MRQLVATAGWGTVKVAAAVGPRCCSELHGITAAARHI